MEKLLHLLKSSRTEDTLTECISYLIEEQSDGGKEFIKKVFSCEAKKLVVRSQFSICIDLERNLIRPDIFITCCLPDGELKHLVIECKYGDGLDDSKIKYFNYFKFYNNCELYLLCRSLDKSTHLLKMKELGLPFAKVITFDDILNGLKDIDEKDKGIFSFLKEHTSQGYKVFRERAVENLRKIESLDLSLQLPCQFSSELLKMWEACPGNKKFDDQREKCEDVYPLEFEFAHPIFGKTFVSIRNQVLFGTFVTKCDSSASPSAGVIVDARRTRVFSKQTNPIVWNSPPELETIMDLFNKIYEDSGGRHRISAYIGSQEGKENPHLAMAMGASHRAIEIVFDDMLELRFKFRRYNLVGDTFEKIQRALRTSAIVEPLVGLSDTIGRGKESFEEVGIKILKITDAAEFFRLAQRILSTSWFRWDDI